MTMEGIAPFCYGGNGPCDDSPKRYWVERLAPFTGRIRQRPAWDHRHGDMCFRHAEARANIIRAMHALRNPA